MATQATLLPAATQRVLDDFVAQCQAAFGAQLVSVVLYGSGAEGRLRSTSDVNLLVLLSEFDAAQANVLREPLRTAHAAVRLRVMFLLQRELGAAAIAFADKLADMQRRRRVLFGSDPLASLTLQRRDEVTRLRQTLLNLVVRLRQRYLLVSLRDEQAALAIAELAGPLRTAAAQYLALAGTPAASPKAALEQVTAQLPSARGLDGSISAARERKLPAGHGAATLLQVIDVAEALRQRALALPED
jgi:hypothetical protein